MHRIELATMVAHHQQHPEAAAVLRAAFVAWRGCGWQRHRRGARSYCCMLQLQALATLQQAPGQRSCGRVAMQAGRRQALQRESQPRFQYDGECIL